MGDTLAPRGVTDSTVYIDSTTEKAKLEGNVQLKSGLKEQDPMKKNKTWCL